MLTCVARYLYVNPAHIVVELHFLVNCCVRKNAKQERSTVHTDVSKANSYPTFDIQFTILQFYEPTNTL